MRDRGTPTKVAGPVMRKLAVLASALLTQGRLWIPEPVRVG